MWGTSSHGDELTGNLANELDAISIDDRGLLRLFAEKSSRVDLGLLQHNRHIRDIARSQIEVRFRCKSAADITAMTGFDRPCETP